MSVVARVAGAARLSSSAANLQQSFDDAATPCGRCDNCPGPWFSNDLAQDATVQAATSLDRFRMPIDPRAQWPTGSAVPRGNIPPAERMRQRRALARLTDLGWSGSLRTLFAPNAQDAPASPAMLAACVWVLPFAVARRGYEVQAGKQDRPPATSDWGSQLNGGSVRSIAVRPAGIS